MMGRDSSLVITKPRLKAHTIARAREARARVRVAASSRRDRTKHAVQECVETRMKILRAWNRARAVDGDVAVAWREGD